jgi:hypothetical protein
MSSNPVANTPRRISVVIISDIHNAGDAERACDQDYELRAIRRPLLRTFVKFYRHHYWMRNPLDQGRQLDCFLNLNVPADILVANGDYTCDTGFVGVSNAAARQSVEECLGKLRAQFGDRAKFIMGDHELGKTNTFSGTGGMRLASWRCATEQLGLQPFWKLDVGNYFLMGVTSSLLALPAHEGDALPDEWSEWQRLREAHLAEIRAALAALHPEQRVILFCHDPTALPFLGREKVVQQHLPQVEQTIIGHLHTRLILWKSRLLAGIPHICFLGKSVERFSSALHDAHLWKPFRVRLCPALSGCQLLNDGGYYVMKLDPAAKQPAQFIFHPLPREAICPSSRWK